MKKLAIVMVLLLAQCASSSLQTSRMRVRLKLDPLKRSEYKVLGNIRGKAVVYRVLFVYWGDHKQASYVDEEPERVESLSRADKAAMYNALAERPEADAVLFPRFTRKVFSIPLLFQRESVEVRAKAISLKAEKP